ncbi:class I SAM-dependent methyltransferase [Mesorhizobium retamae]|uniref:Class I SAM-dependent methyltransferase n=1 Tax=Mesorhizobium retamae TaxID=2912854 RepID=A0ABS9QL46_9HYPH|nr:class I SAM-dependent methyltransferase [Mesorhizobium sp. IRAMC:0171]MCG7508152.1 class I SAM-dependent methyltransferase [Mesorhizobium sp. IRAMC:0171]
MSDQLSYDRTTDVPKIVGCNTRNIEYRWSIFENVASDLKKPSRILDFGAGSLRETYYFAERGHQVTSVDLDVSRMKIFASKYDWSRAAFQPELTVNIPSDRSFDLITAFDVIEHIANLNDVLPAFHKALGTEGMVFCTVPNKRTLLEAVNKRMLARGRVYAPGEAHLQFKSPSEWDATFRSYGFDIEKHEMAIGALANNWYWSVYLGSRVCDRLLPSLGQAMRWFVNPSIMRGFDQMDKRLGAGLSNLYGWNLIILRKAR